MYPETDRVISQAGLDSKTDFWCHARENWRDMQPVLSVVKHVIRA